MASSSSTDDAVDDAREFPGVLDPHQNTLVSVFGRKGSGKSTLNRRLYRSWPLDKLCIDVNREADPGPDAEVLRGDLPSKFPGRLDDNKPRNLHYLASPKSDTFREDLDRGVALLLYPQDRPVLGWLGEIGEFTTGNSTGPHLRTLLMQSRHYRASALMDGPRPKNIDPMIIAQSDLVGIFDLPNPHDRVRVAETIGWDPKRFSDEVEQTRRRGKFWFLLYEARAHRLWRCPPLPQE